MHDARSTLSQLRKIADSAYAKAMGDRLYSAIKEKNQKKYEEIQFELGLSLYDGELADHREIFGITSGSNSGHRQDAPPESTATAQSPQNSLDYLSAKQKFLLSKHFPVANAETFFGSEPNVFLVETESTLRRGAKVLLVGLAATPAHERFLRTKGHRVYWDPGFFDQNVSKIVASFNVVISLWNMFPLEKKKDAFGREEGESQATFFKRVLNHLKPQGIFFGECLSTLDHIDRPFFYDDSHLEFNFDRLEKELGASVVWTKKNRTSREVREGLLVSGRVETVQFIVTKK